MPYSDLKVMYKDIKDKKFVPLLLYAAIIAAPHVFGFFIEKSVGTSTPPAINTASAGSVMVQGNNNTVINGTAIAAPTSNTGKCGIHVQPGAVLNMNKSIVFAPCDIENQGTANIHNSNIGNKLGI